MLRNTTSGGGDTPSFAAKQDFAVGSGATDIVAGDSNGDGRMDLAVAFVNGGGGVSILKSVWVPYDPVAFAPATVSVLRNALSARVTLSAVVANRGSEGMGCGPLTASPKAGSHCCRWRRTLRPPPRTGT